MLAYKRYSLFGMIYDHYFVTDGKWTIEFRGDKVAEAVVHVHAQHPEYYEVAQTFSNSEDVRHRMKLVCGARAFSFCFRNCEHVARYIAEGNWFSAQSAVEGTIWRKCLSQLAGQHQLKLNKWPWELEPVPSCSLKGLEGFLSYQGQDCHVSHDSSFFTVLAVGDMAETSRLIDMLFDRSVSRTGSSQNVPLKLQVTLGLGEIGGRKRSVQVIQMIGTVEAGFENAEILKSHMLEDVLNVDRVLVAIDALPLTESMCTLLRLLGICQNAMNFTFVHSKAADITRSVADKLLWELHCQLGVVYTSAISTPSVRTCQHFMSCEYLKQEERPSRVLAVKNDLPEPRSATRVHLLVPGLAVNAEALLAGTQVLPESRADREAFAVLESMPIERQGSMSSEEWNNRIVSSSARSWIPAGWKQALVQTPTGWAVLLKGSTWESDAAEGAGTPHPGALHRSPEKATELGGVKPSDKAHSNHQRQSAARARRFSDSPCRQSHGPPLGCMGLHRRIGIIQIQKDKLKDLASQQRAELGRLEQECSKLRAKRNIEQASLDLQSYSRSCIEDLTLAELQQCQEQRRRLQAELDSFRAAPDRLRSSRQADAQHVTAREAWLAEQRRLKEDLTNASAHVASLEQELEKGREKDTFDRLASVEQSRQLREQVAEQRQLCRAAQQALRAAETDLAAAQAQRRTPHQTAMPDAGRVAELKADMTALADERREGTEALHVASVELEKLRCELGATTADNAQLRSGLQEVMYSLEQIQRQV
ncbi:unnamed protein product [Symbiodinium sp. KB8]|nr:unnamed protein product [Symbiodinium sp. KB8]